MSGRCWCAHLSEQLPGEPVPAGGVQDAAGPLRGRHVFRREVVDGGQDVDDAERPAVRLVRRVEVLVGGALSPGQAQLWSVVCSQTVHCAAA